MGAPAVLLLLVINVCLVSRSSSRSLEKSSRPSFAGSTGGTWESYVGQIIPPGTPWPAKPEEFATTAKPNLGNKLNAQPDEQTTKPPIAVNRPITVWSAEQTGGTWEGQRIPPGTPWPTKVEDIKNASRTTTEIYDSSMDSSIPKSSTEIHYFTGSTDGTFEGSERPISTPEPVNRASNNDSSTEEKIINIKVPLPSVILDYKPNRPSFAGSTGGTVDLGQKIPPGTPWPVKAEDFSSTTTEKLTELSPNSSMAVSPSIILEYKPNRPSFAGSTGGTVDLGQKIPPGTPWPVKAEDFSSTTTEKLTELIPNSSMAVSPSIILEYKPNRPSFAGSTGGTWENYVGQKVPSEEGHHAISVVNTSRPDQEDTLSPINATIQEEVQTESGAPTRNHTSSGLNTPIVLGQQTQRPSFTGSTGDKPGDQSNSATSLIFPTDYEDTKGANISSNTKPSIVLGYKPNRPSFAGSTGGTWESYVKPSQNSTSPPENEPRLPYVYIGLDLEAVKDAVKNNFSIQQSDSDKPVVISLNLNSFQAKPVNVKQNDDLIKATEQFLVAQKCGSDNVPPEKSRPTQPVLALFLNVEGLTEAVREAYTKMGREYRK